LSWRLIIAACWEINNVAAKCGFQACTSTLWARCMLYFTKLNAHLPILHVIVYAERQERLKLWWIPRAWHSCTIPWGTNKRVIAFLIIVLCCLIVSIRLFEANQQNRSKDWLECQFYFKHVWICAFNCERIFD
jgi:hypothetical protein